MVIVYMRLTYKYDIGNLFYCFLFGFCLSRITLVRTLARHLIEFQFLLVQNDNTEMVLLITLNDELDRVLYQSPSNCAYMYRI